MGISRSAIRVLLREAERVDMTGRVLELGMQDVFATRAELLETMQEFGRKPVRHASQLLSRKEILAKAEWVSDIYFFQALGFSDCKALDVSAYEHADILFDLNQAETPPELVDQWDVVFDGGTIEHVFHTPNALANIFRFLKTGGRVIHMAPSSNHMDHGFYMFSPTLFWDYYKANRFDVNVCQIIRYTRDGGPWEISEYIPGALTPVSLGGLDDALYMVLLIATKTAQSTCDAIPQQGFYQDGQWRSKANNDSDVGVPAAIASRPARLNGSGKDFWYRVRRSIAYRLLGELPPVAAAVPPPPPPPDPSRKELGLPFRYRA
jgi:SAM-dependent methyltransferase